MNLSNPSTGAVIDFDPFSTRTNADPSHNIGNLIEVEDRAFRYAKVGGSNISKGKLQLAPAPKTNHHNCAVSAAVAAGEKIVTPTLGNTAAVADEYDEGYLSVNDVDGEGQTYKISSHPAASGLATLAVTLLDPINVALTTNSEVSLVHNARQGVVEGTAATRRAGGVPLISLAAGDYGWLQTKGVASVLADETLTLGFPLVAGSSTAGAVEEQDGTLGTAQAQTVVAIANIMAGVDTEYRPVSLIID